MARAVGGVLEADVAEHRDDRGLRERGHGEREVALRDAELAEGVDDGDEATFRVAGSDGNHVRFGDAHLDEAVGQGFLERADAGGALHVAGHGEDRKAFRRGAHGALGETGLDLILLHGGRSGRTGSGGSRGLRFLVGFLLLPIRTERSSPRHELRGRGVAGVKLSDPFADFLAVREREAMAAGGVLDGGLDADALHRLDPETNGLLGVRLGGGDALFHREINRLQVVAVGDVNHIPAQGGHRVETRLHGEGILRDAAGELGVVVGKNQHEGIHAVLRGETGDGGEGFLGLAFHRRAVGDRADGDAVAASGLVAHREALRLRETGAERAVADEHALGVEVRLAMTGELAGDAAEALERVEGHAVEAVNRAQGVDAVLGVAGVVHEVERLMPLPPLRGEHLRVDRRHDFREGRRAAPVARRASDDCVDVHERDERAGRAWVGDGYGLASCVLDGDRVFGRGGRRRREAGLEREGLERGGFDFRDNGIISGHRFDRIWFNRFCVPTKRMNLGTVGKNGKKEFAALGYSVASCQRGTSCCGTPKWSSTLATTVSTICSTVCGRV